MLDESVAPSASSHLFLHVLNPFPTEMGGPKAVVKHWQSMMTGFISKCARAGRLAPRLASSLRSEHWRRNR